MVLRTLHRATQSIGSIRTDKRVSSSTARDTMGRHCSASNTRGIIERMLKRVETSEGIYPSVQMRMTGHVHVHPALRCGGLPRSPRGMAAIKLCEHYCHACCLLNFLW